jgi:phage protein D
MPANVTDSYITISGSGLDILSWDVEHGSDGSIGTFSGESSIAALRADGINLVQLARAAADGAPLNVYAGFDGDYQTVFNGILEKCEWDWGADQVHIEGRDMAAVLTDSKNVPTGINYKNQTISQIVTQICAQFNLPCQVSQTAQKAGPQMWGENSYNPHPQSYWSILQDLAGYVGYELFYSPDGFLYFGPPQAANSFNFAWMQQASANPQFPLLKLKTHYDPRNNSDFTVKVVSYHPQFAQHVSATATPTKLNPSGSTKKQKSSSVGTSAGNTGPNKSTLGIPVSPNGKPVLIFRRDGLTAQAAQTRAQAIADDIAKRQIIQDGELWGLNTLRVHSNINIQCGSGTDLMGFESITYQVAKVSHRFSVPDGGSGGWCTSFKAYGSLAA